MIRNSLALFCLLTMSLLNAAPGDASDSRLLIYGGSGRLGSPIVEEALARGYSVTAVTREATRLEKFADRVNIEIGNILDRDHLAGLARNHDAILVSVGGTPENKDPAKYIAALAADSLLEVLQGLGDAAPRLIFVGNLFTLKFEGDKTLLELDRVPESHKNYAMYQGHQLALDSFRRSDVNWTVASPPNGLRLTGRSGNLRWGGDVLLREVDGTPSTISREDFAYAILEELEQANYVRARFNVARKMAGATD